MKLKNKKGFLLAEETLKIVIALICIGFLIYLLASMYFNYQKNKDLELAKASLEYLVGEINSMKEGDVKEVEIYNPVRLWISSWPYQNEKFLPNSCEILGWKNCICICSNLNWDEKIKSVFTSKSYLESIAEECSNWACVEIQKKIIVGESEINQFPIKIENPPLILEIINKKEEIIITKK